MTDHQFRDAMFGGFNRQDVLSFLTQSAAKTNEELEELKHTNEAMRADLDRRADEIDGLEKKLAETGKEREEYRNQAEQLTIEIARVSAADQAKAAELDKTRGELAAANAELEQLRAAVNRLSPDAEAYAAIKDRTAGMELEAHRRAQSVEARAKILAGDLQRQMEQWMAKVEQQYAGLKTEVEASVEQASRQLLSASESLGRINGLLDDQYAALRDVAASYTESIQKKKAE